MFNPEKLKNWFWWLVNASLLVLILLGLSSLKTLYKYQGSLYPSRTLIVSAEGKTTVSPDVTTFTFSVVSEGADPEKIADENNKTMNTTIQFIKEQGVADKDVKTVGYNLFPRYEYDEKAKKTFISGYTLTQTVLVKIRNFSKIGKILGSLPELGINQIGSLNFNIDEPDKYLKVAREEAFEKASIKAKEMAKQNRVRIGRVVTFSESAGGYPPPIPVYETFGRGGAFAAAKAPSIESGSQEVTVNVSVTYEIR
ncbi:MAG: SIMPL domain-containing protein [Candidatus Harrisonbacteria bacterium]|nr:SIMPL domain-containing protein [Candidatus Harrisonbacteria bacterium]